MILHRRDFAQGGVQEALVGLMISTDCIKGIPAMDNNFGRGDCFAIGVMAGAFGETDGVPRKAKRNDLTAAIAQDAR